MRFLYETHVHGSQCSRCAQSTTMEMVKAYYQAGYAGLVLTDHFIFGNTAVSRRFPWEERMECYFAAYLEAKQAAQGLDFDVIFGLEHHYGDGKEVLVYGIGLDFLLENPDIPEIPLEEFAHRVHQAGGILIQAHPYRNRYYVNMAVGPRVDLVDGIEVYNAGNLPGEDIQALQLSRQGSFLMTSGGDIHYAGDPNIGAAGVWLPRRVRDEKEFVQALKQGGYGFRVCRQDVQQIREEDLLV